MVTAEEVGVTRGATGEVTEGDMVVATRPGGTVGGMGATEATEVSYLVILTCECSLAIILTVNSHFQI